MATRHHTPRTGELPAVEREYGSETPPPVAVIDAIGELEDIRAPAIDTELGIVLYDYIEPEALNALFESGSATTDVEVSFEIDVDETYAITITGDHVTVVCNG